MPRRYFLYSTNSDLTAAGATYNKYMLPNLIGSLSASIQSTSIPTLGNMTASFFCYQFHPGDHGQAGSYTASMQISTANNNTLLSVRWHRINSTGTIQSSTNVTPEQTISATGTYTFLSSSVDLGTWANDDRLRVDYMFRNANNMSAQTSAFQYNQTGSFVVLAASNRKTFYS